MSEWVFIRADGARGGGRGAGHPGARRSAADDARQAASHDLAFVAALEP